MDIEHIRMELLDVLQEHMKKALPVPEGVRINFAFRILEGFPTLDDICDTAGVSQETVESVLSKYAHYGVAQIHESSESITYEYLGLSDDIKKFWRGNPVRVESLDKALKAGEDYVQTLESSLDEEGAKEVALWRSAFEKMREEFLGEEP